MSHATDQIEADINQSRHALNDTLSALGNKLSPGQMLDEAIGLAQGQAGMFASKLGRQVRDNPMPSVLIAAGIAWLMMGQRQGQSLRASLDADEWNADSQFRKIEEARWRTPRNPGETESAYNARLMDVHASTLDLKQSAGEAIEQFKERVHKTVTGIEHAASGARHRIAQSFSGAAQYVQAQGRQLGDKAVDAKHSAENFYADTPLAAGAIALAIGALIGGSVPLTEAERTTLRGVADKAARTGADLAERGARMVEERAEAMN